MLWLIVAITREARRRMEIATQRAQREGTELPSQKFAYNKFAVQLEDNLQLNDFIEALRTGGRPLISLEDARRTVELFTAIYRSQRDGKPVRFPLKPEHGSDFDGRLR